MIIGVKIWNYILNQKENNLEILGVVDFTKGEVNTIKNLIFNSLPKSSDYLEISKAISEKCLDWHDGLWVITVGENHKYNIFTNSRRKFACIIWNCKIMVNYSN